jgi:hypothetical protein
MELRQDALNVSTGTEASQKAAGLQAFERHYTVAQLSKLWFFSESTIRRLFIREPGVIDRSIRNQPTSDSFGLSKKVVIRQSEASRESES